MSLLAASTVCSTLLSFLLTEAVSYLSKFPVDSSAERTQPARHGDTPVILMLVLSSERPSLSPHPYLYLPQKNQKKGLK